MTESERAREREKIFEACLRLKIGLNVQYKILWTLLNSVLHRVTYYENCLLESMHSDYAQKLVRASVSIRARLLHRKMRISIKWA